MYKPNQMMDNIIIYHLISIRDDVAAVIEQEYGAGIRL